MATEGKSKDKAKASEDAAERRVIIFELEGIAVDSRTALFDAVKTAIAAYDKEVTSPLFSRFCLNAPATEFVPTLCEFLGVSGRSTDKIIGEIEAAMDEFWKSDSKGFRSGFEEFMKTAQAKGFELVAVTNLSKKAATSALKGLDTEVGTIDIHSFAELKRVLAGADIWMQVAADRDLNPGICIGVTSCGKSCKAVLAADLHCVAVPDGYTDHEDFSGARYLFDSLESIEVDELIAEFYQKD